MKYAIFWAALAAVPVLSVFLSLNRRWLRWNFYGMMAGLFLYQQTAINFFSHEFYKGSARGMEVSLIYLAALAILLALAIRGKWQQPFPEAGIRIYALYFLLCLPSLLNADDVLISWLEVWKMAMLFLCWHAMYGYLAATGDVRTLVKALAVFALANSAVVIRQHYGGVYQAMGVFPHQNGMAMAMNMVGPMFLAGYLQLGWRDRLGRLCAVAFACAGLSSMWSYSRGGIATLPVGYGLAVLCVWKGARRPVKRERILARMWPVALAGVLGLVLILPRLVERFTVKEEDKYKQSSKETRIALAYCAREMILAHPWAGVGINNWSLNMSSDHPYQERAAIKLDRELNFDGIVETVYLLVGAECGIPALLAMLAWFGWHCAACLPLVRHLRGMQWHFVPAGLFGGLSASFLQSVLEWTLRMQMNLVLLMFCFAMIAHLRRAWRRGEVAA